MLRPSEEYYGENIGGYASVTPDGDFVQGLLFHPCDDYYKHSKRVREILKGKSPSESHETNHEGVMEVNPI